MPALTLAYYTIKRITRHRSLVIALFALPIAGSVARAVIPGSGIGSVCAWGCLAAAFALTVGTTLLMCYTDILSGLAAAVRSTPLSKNARIAARITPCVFILTGQAVLFWAVSAIV